LGCLDLNGRGRGLGKSLPEVALRLGHEKILVQLDIFDEMFYGHAKEKVAQILLLHDIVIKQFDGIDQFFFVVGRVHELHAVTFFKNVSFVTIIIL
jgi:hypothetical protein